MTVALDVYDVTNTTHLGTLAEAYGVGWVDDVKIPGFVRFAVDAASADDIALLQPRRTVRVRTGSNPGEGDLPPGGVVQDRPAELTADIEPEPGNTITVVIFECPGLQSWLGYQQGGGVLEPFGSGTDLAEVAGRQVNPRLFGPMSFDYITDEPPWHAPTSGGLVVRAGYPDRRAERFVFVDRAAYRRILTGTPHRAGPARMMLTAAHNVEATVYLDGDQVMEIPRGLADTVIRDIDYDGEDHVLYIDARRVGGSAAQPSVIWSWVTVENGGEPGEETFGLFRTFTPAIFGPGFTPPAWLAIEDDDVPGVTPGFVANVAIAESHARGELLQVTLDPNVTAAQDSNEDPWERTFTHGFRIQEVGRLIDELDDFICEPELGFDNVLRLYNRRGIDRTGDVTVASPFSLSLTGTGVQATRYLYETGGGFGRAVNDPAETALGVVMAKVAQFGTSLGPDQHGQPVNDQLAQDADVVDDIDADLPDDVVPYQDVFPGDVVLCEARDGLAPVRVMSIAGEVTDAGDIEWSAVAEVQHG